MGLTGADGAAPSRKLPVVPYRVTRAGGMLWIDWSDAFRMLLGEKGVAAAVSTAESTACDTYAATQAAWAYAAHAAIAAAAAEMIRYGTAATGQRAVALSGGVFMNRILTGLLAPQLETMGLTVLLHRAAPPNDGCIAIGQAIVAGGAEGSLQL